MARRGNNQWPALAADGKDGKDTREEDPLHLQNSDHSGAILVTSPLNGNNYLSWSRSMKLALGAKTKLGFIDGKIAEPKSDSPTYDQWKKVDCMIISWILNSISKEIVDAFLYARTAKELWADLAERFGECNGPLMYQLQKEIANMRQGSMTIVVYFTKLKKLWDELGTLSPLPPCDCGASKILAERDMREKLIQFLMGLNDTYEHVRSQILTMEPMPSVNRAYSMVFSVEKQKNIQHALNDISENSAMMTRAKPVGRDSGGKGGGGTWTRTRNRRRTKEEKAKLSCDHCQGTGHEMNECFKLHGYPNWWKQLKEQRAKLQTTNMVANDENITPKVNADADSKGPNFSEMIQQEIAKFMSNRMMPGNGNLDSNFNFAHFADYDGP